MLQKFLKEVVTTVAGKSAEPIADLLNSKKHVNEFIIAKKLNLTINQTRNILYKISDYGLVSSLRKKDKKKGWYTYFWKIEALKALEFLKDMLIKKIEQINHQIKSRETKQFYICERCNIEFNEENALIRDFTCHECGDIFKIKDNSEVLKIFRKDLSKMHRDLFLVEKEIKTELEKNEKIKLKEIKKKEAEKVSKRKPKIPLKNSSKKKFNLKKRKIKKISKKEKSSRRVISKIRKSSGRTSKNK